MEGLRADGFAPWPHRLMRQRGAVCVVIVFLFHRSTRAAMTETIGTGEWMT